MNRKIKEMVSVLLTAGIITTILLASIALAAAPELKLPYSGGESWEITEGYNGITHHGKDYYALDFSLPRCDAYDKPILAAADGTVTEISTGHSNGELNSYGNKVVIKHADGYTSLYAHLNQVLVEKDQKVTQGTKIGTAGNTGYTIGRKCKDYPGTHLHFRVLDADGNAYKPEPMSGYTDFKEGQKPLSDNYGIRIVAQSVYCNKQDCSKTSVVPGDELTFVYRINNPTKSAITNIRLGAQIRSSDPQGIWRDDPTNDAVIEKIESGVTQDYSRKFKVPLDVTSGFYDAKWVILYHDTGSWIDSKEMDRVLKVKDSEPNPQPSLTLIYPTGGENWIAGTTQTIRWRYTGDVGEHLSIDILKGGKTVGGLDTYMNLGSAKITVPDTPGNDYQIRITSIEKPEFSDISSNYFTISAKLTPIITFSKTFGTADQDQGMMARQTSDGGYIMVGNTAKGLFDGSADALLVKTDKKGNKQWQQTFGGSSIDNAYSVAETSDGGYIFVGSVQSPVSPYVQKGWIVKVKKDGAKDWEKILTGGPTPADYRNSDGFRSIEPTSDGGFIISGYTNFDTIATRVYMQAWLVKLDKNYNIVWNKAYGSSGAYKYSASSAKQAPDGTYLVAIRTGHPVSWVARVDADGKELNWKGFTESGYLDYAITDIAPTPDGGYALLGYKRSNNAIAWLSKVDSNDITAWTKTYEEINTHVLMNSIQQTKDGYIMAGSKSPMSGPGYQKGMVIKAGADGSEKDRKVSSETNQNNFQSIEKTNDGGYILAGSVRLPETGKDDAWLLKTDANVNI